jgi:hypothetical protein
VSIDFGTLAQFLAWAVMGPGAGALSFWALEKLAWFQQRTAEHKRYLSLAGTRCLPSRLWPVVLARCYTGGLF